MRLLGMLALFSLSLAAADVAGAIAGTVQAIDRGTKTVVIKTADGAVQTFHVAAHATVDGAVAAGHGTMDAYDGLKEGDEVVVHYTARGAVKTGDEFDRVGADGLHRMEGTAQQVNRSAKTITVKTADGTVQTFHLTSDLAKETGQQTAQGTEKARKVTVYYTESAGKKVAHFFKGS